MRCCLKGLEDYGAFSGYALLNTDSKFKAYLSYILTHLCIKSKNNIILPHSQEHDENININESGYSSENNGFKVISINWYSYGTFLSYKIQTLLPDPEDVSFSFNALFPRFDNIEKLHLDISDDKWGYINDQNRGKGAILNAVRCDCLNKEEFSNLIFKKICGNYLYNLNRNEYGDLMFNVCVELPTKDGNIRRTTIALKYDPTNSNIYFVTIT